MSKFESIAAFKAAAEFFPRGQIIPVRILSADKKKHLHGVLFGSDAWAIPTPNGYLIACDNTNGGAIKILSGVKNCRFDGSPYTHGGGTHWIGRGGSYGADVEWLKALNEAYQAKQTKEPS